MNLFGGNAVIGLRDEREEEKKTVKIFAFGTLYVYTLHWDVEQSDAVVVKRAKIKNKLLLSQQILNIQNAY